MSEGSANSLQRGSFRGDQVWNSLVPALEPTHPGEGVQWCPKDSLWHARHPASPGPAQAKGAETETP